MLESLHAHHNVFMVFWKHINKKSEQMKKKKKKFCVIQQHSTYLSIILEKNEIMIFLYKIILVTKSKAF